LAEEGVISLSGLRNRLSQGWRFRREKEREKGGRSRGNEGSRRRRE
jgi:hypothetical protein